MYTDDPLAMLDAALLTAHVGGVPREVVARLQHIRRAMVCERCERDRDAPMPMDPSLVPSAISTLIDARDRCCAVADSLESLATRSDIPTDVMRVIAAAAAELRSIGGPTDPNVGG